MKQCMKCGAILGDFEKACPLCGTNSFTSSQVLKAGINSNKNYRIDRDTALKEISMILYQNNILKSQEAMLEDAHTRESVFYSNHDRRTSWLNQKIAQYEETIDTTPSKYKVVTCDDPEKAHKDFEANIQKKIQESVDYYNKEKSERIHRFWHEDIFIMIGSAVIGLLAPILFYLSFCAFFPEKMPFSTIFLRYSSLRTFMKYFGIIIGGHLLISECCELGLFSFISMPFYIIKDYKQNLANLKYKSSTEIENLKRDLKEENYEYKEYVLKVSGNNKLRKSQFLEESKLYEKNKNALIYYKGIEDIENKSYKAELKILDNTRSIIEANIKRSKEVLDLLWANCDIYEKYHSFDKISLFYEYLLTGRAKTIGEAYNLYENAVFQKSVLSQLRSINIGINQIISILHKIESQVSNINNHDRLNNDYLSNILNKSDSIRREISDTSNEVFNDFYSIITVDDQMMESPENAIRKIQQDFEKTKTATAQKMNLVDMKAERTNIENGKAIIHSFFKVKGRGIGLA